MRRVMVDIETLGTDPGSAILSIGAVEFGHGLSFRKPFFRAISLFSSLMAGLTVNPETVEWWRRQSPEAKGAAQPHSGQLMLPDALEDFARFIDGTDEVWAKGPDFDLVLLEAAYTAIGRKRPWSYRKARDCRTIYALADVRETPAGVDHSAVDDAIAQAKAVTEAYAKLGVAL